MFTLTTPQRDELLQTYRKDPDPELRSRARASAYRSRLLALVYGWRHAEIGRNRVLQLS